MQTKTASCLGCGAILQINQPEKPGFVKDLAQPFCMDCFKLMHYGQSETHHHPDDLPVFNPHSLILVVVSIMYIDTIFKLSLANRGEKYHITYLINQVDLLPPHTNLDLLLEKTIKKAKSFGISYDDIVLMSAKNPNDIDHLKSYIKIRRFKDVYLIGLQNSGKTTIFKALTGNQKALAMRKAALTQHILNDEFEGHMIYDTPGLYQKGFLHEFFDYDVYKDMLPQKTFKPKNGKLELGDALLIEGIVGIAIIKGSTTSVFYGSNQVKLHVTKEQKALELLQNKNLFKHSMSNYIKTDISLKAPTKYQLTLADFGLLHLVGPVTIRLFHHPDFYYSISEVYFQ